MKSDFHMHTHFSEDSNTLPEDMIRGAIKKGLKTICFTDHYDYDFPVPGEHIFDVDEYFAYMLPLQEKFKDIIDVRIGIELGIEPRLADYYNNLVKQGPFDFVIGSAHCVLGIDPVMQDYFGRYDDETGYRLAFEDMHENVKANDAFDVLGHIDYIVRYSEGKTKHYSYQKYADEIDEVLKCVISKGKGIEVNTAGLKYKLGFAHPTPDVLKRYKELGGEIITVGADGHIPGHIAYDFHLVDQILLDCGFKYYTEFKQRKPIFYKI